MNKKHLLGVIVIITVVGLSFLGTRKAQAANATGVLDSNNPSGSQGCSTLNGWAWDPDLPNTPTSIAIYKDGGFVANVLADTYRGDLQSGGYGNGNHGFSYTIPSSWKDGANHSIIVYSYDLNGGSNNPLVLGTPTVHCNPPLATCTGATPDGDWTIASSGNRLVTISGVSSTVTNNPGTSGVLVYWWTDAHYQAPLFSGWATPAGGGTWTMNVPLNPNSPDLGGITVYAYLLDGLNPAQGCDYANFTRLNNGTINVNSNSATSWSITCPLTNTNCPNITSGANQTTGSYPSEPYSTWTITPADISGYDWKVNSCALNTACGAVFP